jgi:hypothetical protein
MLPAGDIHFPIRWNLLKGHFSRVVDKGERVSKSRAKRRAVYGSAGSGRIGCATRKILTTM